MMATHTHKPRCLALDYQYRYARPTRWKLHRVVILCWAAFIMLLVCDVASARNLESAQRLQDTAIQYVTEHAGNSRIQASAKLPDSRLNLPECKVPLQASAGELRSRMQVRVSCPGLWSLYVPVSVSQEKQLIVTTRSLASNELIAASDVSLEWKKVADVSYGHFDSIEAVVGRKTIRPLNAGKVLRPNQLRQAAEIHKGDTVTLLSKIGSLEIRGRGTALHDAVENSRVQVRNSSSGKLVEGYSRGNGIVEING